MTTTLEQPRTVKAAILRELILRPEISEMDVRFNSFRSRISDLRLEHGLNVRYKEKKAKNAFGNDLVYRVHYLWQIDLKKAVRLYKKINHG
jgi:hypothetical protein